MEFILQLAKAGEVKIGTFMFKYLGELSKFVHEDKEGLYVGEEWFRIRGLVYPWARLEKLNKGMGAGKNGSGVTYMKKIDADKTMVKEEQLFQGLGDKGMTGNGEPVGSGNCFAAVAELDCEV